MSLNFNKSDLCSSKLLKTDVTVVKFYKNYVVAGIGNFLHIYNRITHRLLTKIQIFHGQKIHGVYFTSSDKILIFGGYQIFLADFCNNSLNKPIYLTYPDWILDAILIENEIVTISAHNRVTTRNITSIIWEQECEINSILYSASLVLRSELYALAGTVFSEILIWTPKISSKVLFRLLGHQGVIFSLNWNQELGLICSTSDDRSIRLWEIDTNPVNAKLKTTIYGHTARVMRGLILSDCVVSAGEDSLINVWDFDGTLLHKIEAHQSDCVWSLDCDGNEILSGGGDGSICLNSLKLEFRVTKTKNIHPDDDFKKIAFVQNEIIYITESGIFSKIGSDDFKDFEGLKNISFDILNDIAIGGLSNEIHILNSREVFLLDVDSVLSLHWLNESRLIICSQNGVLRILNTKNGVIDVMEELPKSRERWTTSACKYEDYICVGDRVGNIHLYWNGKLVQSLSKIHGRLGVTFLGTHQGLLYSTGRDGTIRKYKLLKLQLQEISILKLPFKWCTKIDFANNIAIGFYETKFIIWNLQLHRKVLEYNCGGGHRSWDYKHNKLIYIKDKQVHIIEFSERVAVNLSQGFHSHEVNCIHPVGLLYVSGGEDTTIKLSNVNFEVLSTYNFHLSSIRCITSIKVNNETYVISGGGRAQFVIWKLENNELYLIKSEILKNLESESRVMDITTKINGKGFYIICASSDGQIQIYSYENNLIFIKSIENDFCLLKILCGERIIVTSTLGEILFYSFPELCLERKIKVHQSGINSLAINSDLILTGGDDCDIALSRQNVICRTTRHCSQVTGLLVVDDFVISCSTDQRITVLRIQNLEFVAQICTAVSDLLGICLVNLGLDFVEICVYGKGMEVLKLNLKNLKNK